jgi:hypothetical protein
VNYDEFLLLSSEVKQLESMLEEIPASNVINRLGLESRLKRVKAAVAGFNSDALPKKARLTFRGRPVIGSHGVSADFASRASSFFTDAFSAVLAGLNENLRYMGPIPDKQRHQLLITGTAIGSFGFEYELPKANEQDPPGQAVFFSAPAQPEIAMDKIEKLFEVASSGTDDDIAELVDEIHPRAVKKAAEFLQYLSDQGAWCALEFKETHFRFTGPDQVRTSADRLKSNNIKENEETFYGEFQGVLPKGRTFEFKLRDQDGVLKGKVGPQIEDADVLNREFLHKLVTARFHVIQVGQGRPRYTLQKIDDIE